MKHENNQGLNSAVFPVMNCETRTHTDTAACLPQILNNVTVSNKQI